MFDLIDILIDPVTPQRIIIAEQLPHVREYLQRQAARLDSPQAKRNLDGVARALEDALFRISEQRRLQALNVEGRLQNEVTVAWQELDEEVQTSARSFARLRPITLQRALSRLEGTGLAERIPGYREFASEFAGRVSVARRENAAPRAPVDEAAIIATQELYREVSQQFGLPRRTIQELACVAHSLEQVEVLRRISDALRARGAEGGRVLQRMIRAHPSLVELRGDELKHFIHGVQRREAASLLALLDSSNDTREFRRAVSR